MTTGIIYLAKNIISLKCYVGQTTRTLEQRRKEHYWSTIKDTYKFGRALQKYKETDWEWSVLAEVPVEELTNHEIFFINDLDTYKNGYNTLTGDTWATTGNPKYNSTIYELWHPEFGTIKETLGELYNRSASFGHISELIKGKRFQINGYVLAKNKDKYSSIFKIYDFYHPEHGVVTCTTIELFKKYPQYFNGKESKIYNLVGGRCQVCAGWVLAKNKDRYENLKNTCKEITLTHPEHGTLTLKTSEFKNKYGLTDSSISFLKSGKYKSSMGWTFNSNGNDNTLAILTVSDLIKSEIKKMFDKGFYLPKDVKVMIQSIYDNLGIIKTAKANDIESALDIKLSSKKIDEKIVKGYFVK